MQGARHGVIHFLSCIAMNDISPQRAARESVDLLFHKHLQFKKWDLLDKKRDMSLKVRAISTVQ
jgi:hypothetical protein